MKLSSTLRIFAALVLVSIVSGRCHYPKGRVTRMTASSIAVEVRGSEDKASDFRVIDSFSIPLTTSASK
jgi:hypothetical protein